MSRSVLADFASAVTGPANCETAKMATITWSGRETRIYLNFSHFAAFGALSEHSPCFKSESRNISHRRVAPANESPQRNVYTLFEMHPKNCRGTLWIKLYGKSNFRSIQIFTQRPTNLMVKLTTEQNLIANSIVSWINHGSQSGCTIRIENHC